MTNLVKLPTRADKNHVFAVVETPRGSNCKLDFDPKLASACRVDSVRDQSDDTARVRQARAQIEPSSGLTEMP